MKNLKATVMGLFLAITGIASAQYNVLEYNPQPTVEDGRAYLIHEDYNNRVLEYPYVREDDVMWTKEYIQKIDLKQKINMPLYFPVNPTRDRMSLSDVLFNAVLNDKTIAAYDDEYFEEKLSVEQINKRLFSVDSIPSEDFETGEEIMLFDTLQIRSRDIIEYLVREERFFDKKRSVIDVRIIAMCPVAEYQNTETFQIEKRKLFWVYFPDARPVLANANVYNVFNNAERMTFDELFHKRMFSAIIQKETNLYDRAIYDYKTFRKIDQLLEAERIKEEIRNFESDLWEY